MSNAHLKGIPVVLLTVSQRDEDVMEALKTKMNYYLAKPITSTKLSVLVRAICELQAEHAGGERHPAQEETHVRLVYGATPYLCIDSDQAGC